MHRRALGIDGTRDGWIAVVLDDDAVAEVVCAHELAGLLDDVGDVPTGIDIPIGLLDAPRRAADVAARSLLGRAAASVFAAPCRAVVDAFRAGDLSDHAAATALSRRVTGMGISRQTWNIVPKIAEVDALVDGGATPHEVHPELAFRLCAGRPLAGKRSWNGLMARLELLRGLGVIPPSRIDGCGDRVAPDDVVDAAVVAWTVAGLHRAAGLDSHPPVPQEFDRGRPVAIWTRPCPGVAGPSQPSGSDVRSVRRRRRSR